MFRDRAHRLHFIGIGGIGMSGIAEVLVNLGFDVRGSDVKRSLVTQRLASLGASIFQGHAAEHVADADVVVVSSAVGSDNPEVQAARAAGIPVIRRAEMLAELMRLKYGVAVAGMHGKTTTTSFVADILHHGGVDPTVVIGGRLKSLGSNARLGEGEYLVAEADESDGSFLRLVPTIAVVTNVDAEHLDHWEGGLPQIVEAFENFINKVPFYGAAVLCLDHPTVQAMLPRIEKRYVTYGFSPQANFSASAMQLRDGAVEFAVARDGEPLGQVRLAMVGRHNVLNALAAIAVADEVGVPFELAAEALGQFEGIGRRFERRGEAAGVRVVDDYAHHPQELRATLQAAREAYGGRIIVAFQPHRYTRTRDLFDEFATAFNDSDVLRVADVYAAGEAPIEDVEARSLALAVSRRGHKNAQWSGSVEQTAEALAAVVRPGDLVLTLGAGDIHRAGEQLLEQLQAAAGRGRQKSDSVNQTR